MRRQLGQIQRSAVGQILFNSFRFWKIPVLISPYNGTDTCNAEVTNDHMDDKGIIYPRVGFTPSLLGRGLACWKILVKYNQTNAGLPHEVLFHELIHAFRHITKSASKNYGYRPSTGALQSYTDDEEFYAVVITNIFISDPGNAYKTGLRASHASARALESELADSFGFFRSSIATFRLIEKFCKENPGFSKAVANVPAKFNPLAAYYTNPQKARELSAHPSTLDRDVRAVERKMLQQINPPRNPSVPHVPGLDTI